MNISFEKYHALGNDYLVLHPDDAPEAMDEHFIKVVCHRNFGLGSDGILLGPLESEAAPFRLRIYNPDASEAEKSGNGLRIFCRYLLDTKRVNMGEPFRIETLGGIVTATVHSLDRITVEMGRVSFDSKVIPVTGPQREVLSETMTIDGADYAFCAATIGNPHCVLPLPEISRELACRIGPRIERDNRFPNRTNVQLLKVIDRKNIAIEIWERGAGYTLASGSSSSAAGAVARRLGLVDDDITVHMPGGEIELHIDPEFGVRMTGPATRVGAMHFDAEALGVSLPEE